MPSPGIACELLDGGQARAHADDLASLYGEVYGEVHGGAGDGAPFRARLRVWCRQPGFALAEARHGGYLVGFAAGMPLRSSTSWWRDVTTPLPAEFTSERPGRTFAVTELLVRAPWRRQGIGLSLHDLLLGGRGEERATVTLPPGATAAQHAFRGWGWRRAARARAAGAGEGAREVLVITLSGGP